MNPYEGGGAPDENLTWHLEGVNTSLVRVEGDYDPADVFTFTPVPNAYGVNLVRFVLVDHGGYYDDQAIWINITPVNDPPELRAFPDLMIRYETPYTFNYISYISDIDTQVSDLILTVTEVKPDVSDFKVSVSGHTITYEAPESLKDQVFSVIISVSDGTTMVSDNIDVSVSDNWVPELVKPLPDVTVMEGERKKAVFDLDDFFLDKDMDMMFFTYGNEYVKIYIDDEQVVDVESTSEWSGQELVTFRATDSKGALIEDDVLITVIPYDDSPIIEDVPDLMIRYDTEFTFDLAAYITDVDTSNEALTMTFSDIHVWWAWDPEKLPQHPPKKGFSKLSMMMEFPQVLGTETAPYTIDLTITVTDGTSKDSDTISITVSDNFSPEVATPLPDVEFDEDSVLTNAFKLSSYFLDRDGDDLVCSAESKVLTSNIKADLNVDIFAPPNWNGEDTITFRVTDPKGAIVEDSVLATVTPVNDPPGLDIFEPVEMDENTILSITIDQNIHDIDDEFNKLDIQVTTSDPSLRPFVSGSEVVLFADEVGTFVVTIKVVDPSGDYAEGYIDITVNEVKKPVPPPNGGNQSLLSTWLLLVIVIIIAVVAAVGGYAGYRKIYGKYFIEEAFMIRNDGRMIAHVSKDPVSDKDQDIFSSMVAAVHLFIEDTFKRLKEDTKPSIQKMEYRGNIILVERGTYMFLALMIKGMAGSKLYDDMRRFMADTEETYGLKVKEWDGDLNELKDISFDLTTFIPEGYSATLANLEKSFQSKG